MIRFEDWRAPIIEMVATKQALADRDPRGLFPHHFPEVAATEDEVQAAERALAVTLEPEYRSFLKFSNGWNGFYQDVSLLSTTELVAGPLRNEVFEALDNVPELLEDLDWSPQYILPIGASLEQADSFVMLVGEGGVCRDQVYWLAEGELIDTYETFGQFFVSMIDYTKLRIAKMQQQAAQEE